MHTSTSPATVQQPLDITQPSHTPSSLSIENTHYYHIFAVFIITEAWALGIVACSVVRCCLWIVCAWPHKRHQLGSHKPHTAANKTSCSAGSHYTASITASSCSQRRRPSFDKKLASLLQYHKHLQSQIKLFSGWRVVAVVWRAERSCWGSKEWTEMLQVIGRRLCRGHLRDTLAGVNRTITTTDTKLSILT